MPFVDDREGRYIGCWAITEPEHGSDTLIAGHEDVQRPEDSGRSCARLDGDEYVINGQKSAWVSNGTIATHALAFLGIDRRTGQDGGGVALVPLNSARRDEGDAAEQARPARAEPGRDLLRRRAHPEATTCSSTRSAYALRDRRGARRRERVHGLDVHRAARARRSRRR